MDYYYFDDSNDDDDDHNGDAHFTFKDVKQEPGHERSSSGQRLVEIEYSAGTSGLEFHCFYSSDRTTSDVKVLPQWSWARVGLGLAERTSAHPTLIT